MRDAMFEALIHTFSWVLLSAEDYVRGISWMNWQSHRDSGSAAAALAVGEKSWVAAAGTRVAGGRASVTGAGTAANAVTSSCLTLRGEPLAAPSVTNEHFVFCHKQKKIEMMI